MTRATCPSLAELEALERGDPGLEAAAAHAATCARCARRLEMIRGNNDLLEELSGLSRTGVLEPAPDAGAVEAPGYEIVGEIHRGAQGVVYEAVQVSTHRRVALKVLLAGALATSRQRRRFEREIDVIASLRHPNIVTVYECGVAARGHHYFAMEHVVGRPLDRFVREDLGAPPLTERQRTERILRLMVKVCSAVACAHQHGVIHRDLKPTNILVDAEGEPRVVDFGLAKAISADSAAAPTRTGEFMGTVAYASPEQASGRADSIDVRSDVYSLGVVLYELLSDRRPYNVDGPLREALNEIADTDPAPMRRAGRRVDAELETIVRKALAKEPARRYQSAGALGEDLERFLGGRAIEARRDSTWYILRKTVARHRAPAMATGAFLMLLMVFSATVTFMYGRARVEARKANTIRLFLEDTLGSVEPVRPGQETTVRQVLDEAVHWIDIALADEPEVQASIRMTVGNSYRSLGRFDDAERQLSASLAIRREVFGDAHPQVAESLNAMGLLRWSQQRRDEARDLFAQGLAMRRRTLGNTDPAVAISLMNLALVQAALGDLEGAGRSLRECYDIRLRRHGRRSADVAMVEYRLGALAERRDDLAEAGRWHASALETREGVLQEGHPDITRSLLALGRVHMRAGECPAAEPLLRRCVELCARTWGEDDLRTAEARCALGRCLSGLGRYDEAEHALLSGHATLDSLLGFDDEQTLAAVGALAELYEAAGRADDAASWRARLGAP